jgi:hypothetical protein
MPSSVSAIPGKITDTAGSTVDWVKDKVGFGDDKDHKQHSNKEESQSAMKSESGKKQQQDMFTKFERKYQEGRTARSLWDDKDSHLYKQMHRPE